MYLCTGDVTGGVQHYRFSPRGGGKAIWKMTAEPASE